MEAQRTRGEAYAVPTYEALPGAVWYHFLHGNVPGHQIDFMYRPEVPQGALTRQHFSHLARIMKYIEPRAASAYAFAIANLSRDDTQYEPGRGGVALIFGLRIQGAKDHAGRHDPPFSHAAAAIERNMDEATFFRTALAFYGKISRNAALQIEDEGWYHQYARQEQDPEALLRAYVEGYEDLPAPGSSRLGFRWTVEGSAPPKRVVIVYPDHAPFEQIARCAARIAGVLIESDIRWTSISNGREADVAGGVSIRLVPAWEAVAEGAGMPVFGIEEVPDDPKALAEALFGAKEVRASQAPGGAFATWRRFSQSKESPEGAAPQAEAPAQPEIEVEFEEAQACVGGPEKKAEEGASADAGVAALAADVKKKRAGLHVPVLVGLGVVLAIGGTAAAIALHDAAPAAKSGPGEVARMPPAAVVPVEIGHSVDAPGMAPVEATSPAAPKIAPTVAEAGEGQKPKAAVRSGAVGASPKRGKPAATTVIVVPD